MYVCFAVFLIGYIISYFIITPILMKKHGKRSYRESYLWIINCFYAEDDLKFIYRETGDVAALKTIKIITLSKYAILAAVLSFVMLFLLG